MMRYSPRKRSATIKLVGLPFLRQNSFLCLTIAFACDNFY